MFFFIFQNNDLLAEDQQTPSASTSDFFQSLDDSQQSSQPSQPPPLSIEEEVFSNYSPQSTRIEKLRPRHRKHAIATRNQRRLSFHRSKSLPAPPAEYSHPHSSSQYVPNSQQSPGNSGRYSTGSSAGHNQHYPLHHYLSSSSAPSEGTLPEEDDIDLRMRGEESGSPSSLSEVDSALGGSTTSPGSCRKANRFVNVFLIYIIFQLNYTRGSLVLSNAIIILSNSYVPEI